MTSNQEQTLEKIEAALDTMRPWLKADGGDIEIVGLSEDMVLSVRLMGACESCPQSDMTMKAGIEEAVKRAVPGIRSVVALNAKKKTG